MGKDGLSMSNGSFKVMTGFFRNFAGVKPLSDWAIWFTLALQVAALQHIVLRGGYAGKSVSMLYLLIICDIMV